MCGLSDLYDVPQHELEPALAEMAHLLRIVPLLPAVAAEPLPRPSLAATAGDSFTEQGVQ